MNGGTNRGQADGFQLSVLNKVKDVKTQVCERIFYLSRAFIQYDVFQLTKPYVVFSELTQWRR